MMLNDYVARELVADRLRTLQAAYSSAPRLAARRSGRRWRWRPTHRTSMAAGHA
jgi:hypothetical protein